MDESKSLSGTLDEMGSPDVTWVYSHTFTKMYPGGECSKRNKQARGGGTMAHMRFV